MNLEEYEVMYRVEDRHWWYLGMEQITRSLVERALPPNRETRSLAYFRRTLPHYL
jgi:hypothetical protein